MYAKPRKTLNFFPLKKSTAQHAEEPEGSLQVIQHMPSSPHTRACTTTLPVGIHSPALELTSHQSFVSTVPCVSFDQRAIKLHRTGSPCETLVSSCRRCDTVFLSCCWSSCGSWLAEPEQRPPRAAERACQAAWGGSWGAPPNRRAGARCSPGLDSSSEAQACKGRDGPRPQQQQHRQFQQR